MARIEVKEIVCAGEDGSAVGTALVSAGHGQLDAVSVAIGSAPATTDVVITEVGGLGRTLVTLADMSADVVIYPRVQATSNAGAGLTGEYVPYSLSGATLQIAVDDANDDDVITVIIQVI